MTTLFHNIEKIIKDRQASSVYLSALLKGHAGMDLTILHQEQTVESTVYGRTAGQTQATRHPIRGIVVSDDFFPSDDISFGGFQEGYLYTNSEIPKVGDVVEINRPNNQVRRYKIHHVESIGTSNNVFHRFSLAAMS